MVEKVEIKYRGQTKNVPTKYLSGLKGKERTAQIKSIFEGTKRPKTSAPSRKSSYTVRFNKKYGEKLDNMKGGRSKKNIAKVTGIPLKAIDEVYRKGEGAFRSSGSRPNQTPQSWAQARVYSYILGGGARKSDKSITEKYSVKFPK